MDPKSRPAAVTSGFALAAVLMVMAAMLLMAVSVMALVSVERKTARSYVEAKRAEWIARAGMEDVRSLLREQTANDDFLIVAKAAKRVEPDREQLDHLYLARGRLSGDSAYSYELFPLFSAEEESVSVGDLEDVPEVEGLIGREELEFSPRKWADEARVSWVDVLDGKDRVVGRYGFWVEDLQARLDGSRAGNDLNVGSHARSEWPFPAPGALSIPGEDRSETALFALDPEVIGDLDESELDDRLIRGDGLLLSPDSVLAAAEFQPPLSRGPDGKLEDRQAHAFEAGVNAGTVPYLEQPVVPYAEGVGTEFAGKPKLDLNELLLKDRSTAIDDFAAQVEDGLPEFVQRQGAFPDDYLRTLAAGAMDYADEDSDGSVMAGSYRGLDSYPLVNEFLTRFRWEDIERSDGRKYLILSGTMYAEFWNMSNKEVSGTVEVSYETNYSFELGVVPDLNLGSPDFLDDPEIAAPGLKKEGGYYWLPEFTLTLQPNEYRLVNLGGVRYRIDAGPESVWVTSPIVLSGDENGESGYRMKWNGTVVDQARMNAIRPDIHINYPLNTKSKPRQGIWSTIPGHSYSPARFKHVNNMGDPRMAFYLNLPQDPNDYPDNYSPNRRNIRWGNIYALDSSTKPRVYGRVMPSEWPDGGHNTSFGQVPPAIRAGRGRGSARGDERIDPDDPQFFQSLPDVEPDKAPMRISNEGRFFSATELGRVYDPVMWQPTFPSVSKTKQLLSGRMPTGETSWPDVESQSAMSEYYGGGNTLRIGRHEHPRFDHPGLRAAHLLDLFYAQDRVSRDPKGETGTLIWVNGEVNVNTASRDVLRALAVGLLKQDPVLAQRNSNSHRMTDLMAPPTSPLELGTPAIEKAADLIADAVIRERPFASAAEFAAIKDAGGDPIFGNRMLYPERDRVQWSDAAAEEVFARMYNSSTFRSRNFRVWVVGQALAPRDRDANGEPMVLAESRKVYTVFAGPDERQPDGSIDVNSYRPRVIHENDH